MMIDNSMTSQRSARRESQLCDNTPTMSQSQLPAPSVQATHPSLALLQTIPAWRKADPISITITGQASDTALSRPLSEQQLRQQDKTAASSMVCSQSKVMKYWQTNSRL